MRSDVHPTAEGLRMELEELDNKHLNRAKLYGEDEPKEFVSFSLFIALPNKVNSVFCGIPDEPPQKASNSHSSQIHAIRYRRTVP